MLSDRCLSCPVCLCVTLVYCDQTVGWIKMPLDMEVGLCPGYIMLHGNSAPPKGESQHAAPTFWPMYIATKRSPISATAELLFFYLTALHHLKFADLLVPARFSRLASCLVYESGSSWLVGRTTQHVAAPKHLKMSTIDLPCPHKVAPLGESQQLGFLLVKISKTLIFGINGWQGNATYV